MKVFHIITTINRGGAENHLRDLIDGQMRLYNVEATCAYLKGNSYWAQDLERIGCQVNPLQLRRYGEIRPALRLRRLIQDFAPDIVHAHLAPAELYARVALLGGTVQKVPMLITRHNHNRFYDGRGAEFIERWVTSRAQHFIGTSESVRRHFSEKISGISERFTVIPYGIDAKPMTSVSCEQILRLRQEWGVEKDTILMGTVARLVSIKALHVLLEGFARLRKEHPGLPLKLVIVGDGPLETSLRKLALELGLGRSVVWAGFRQDIPIVMNALDVFVLTSRSEGFGLVLLEAMSASKPIICTKVGALPEIVVEGETGLMVPVENVGALTKAMAIMAQDSALRRRFGEAGFRLTAAKFSLDSMYQKTMAVYHQVLEQRKISQR